LLKVIEMELGPKVNVVAGDFSEHLDELMGCFKLYI